MAKSNAERQTKYRKNLKKTAAGEAELREKSRLYRANYRAKAKQRKVQAEINDLEDTLSGLIGGLGDDEIREIKLGALKHVLKTVRKKQHVKLKSSKTPMAASLHINISAEKKHVGSHDESREEDSVTTNTSVEDMTVSTAEDSMIGAELYSISDDDASMSGEDARRISQILNGDYDKQSEQEYTDDLFLPEFPISADLPVLNASEISFDDLMKQTLW